MDPDATVAALLPLPGEQSSDPRVVGQRSLEAADLRVVLGPAHQPHEGSASDGGKGRIEKPAHEGIARGETRRRLGDRHGPEPTRMKESRRVVHLYSECTA